MHLSLFAGMLLNTITSVINVEMLHFKSPLEFVPLNTVQLREKRGKVKPFCSEVEEHPFANCLKLRLAGKCDKSSLMRSWCPRTCKFCMEDRAPAHVPCIISRFGCCADGITAAKGKGRLGCPEMCQDNIKFKEVCRSYAKNGYCTIYYSTLKKICPRSCRMCGKEIVNGCYNKLDDSKCKRLSLYGYCRSAASKKRMAQLCGLTCEACLDKAPKLSKITPKCAKEGCCWDRKTPLSKGCPPCRDSFPRSICPRFRLECPYIDRLQAVQMRMFCPATCGVCDTRTCKDDSVYGIYCKTWKKYGECKRNKNAMRLFCKRTCNFC